MTLKEIQKALEHRNLRKVAETTGVSYDTVWRIAKNRSKNPSFYNVEKIKDYLEKN